jgi:death on curing protein
MKKLSLAAAEYIAHQLANELFAAFDEPMPEFGTRYPGRLESCLEQPFQTYNGKDLYGKDICSKASVLFYLVIKNHPFENGNKRMAVTLTLVFLFINGYWIKAEPEELYDVALDVARSKPNQKDAIMDALKTVLEEYIYKHGRGSSKT